jgi:hypothetical protein
MRPDEVEQVVQRCEEALAAGTPVDLRALGFWRAVAVVKRDPTLVERYADRIGRIDRLAFERGVRLRVPIAPGALVLSGGALLGLLLVAVASRLVGIQRDLALLGGAGLLLATTHDLAHLAVGRLVGIHFAWWFLDGPTRLQPGLKTDYTTYLHVAPRDRAGMHAAGALTTKIVPFLLLPLANGSRAQPVLLGIGLVQILTDVVFSTRQSDWKRVRRELRVPAR